VWAKACLLNGPRWAAERKPDMFRVLFFPFKKKGRNRCDSGLEVTID
jgi:hypothetical protein